MESIHISELRKLLAQRGLGRTDEFLRISFIDPKDDGSPGNDPEFADKVLTVNSVFGLVTITFNHRGYLISIDVE